MLKNLFMQWFIYQAAFLQSIQAIPPSMPHPLAISQSLAVTLLLDYSVGLGRFGVGLEIFWGSSGQDSMAPWYHGTMGP